MRRNVKWLGMGSVLTALCLLVVGACAEARPPQAPEGQVVAKAPTPHDAPDTPMGDAGPLAGPACDLVCQGAQVVSHEVRPSDTADEYTTRAVEKANATLNAMHDDLLACYTTRIKSRPKAHGFLTIDIVIGPEGSVQGVETEGGALLGDAAMSCITERIRQGKFEPPHGGGTMHLQVPFILRRMGPDDAI